MERSQKHRDLKVYVRLYPTMHRCKEVLKYDLATNTVFMRCNDTYTYQDKHPPRFWSFRPERLFCNSSQKKVYNEVTNGVLEISMRDGNDAVIMAYGQAGSGKTFTMSGMYNRFHKRGLIPRFVARLLLTRLRCDMKVHCDMSYLEINGHHVIDLFSGNRLDARDLRKVPTVPLTTHYASMAKLMEAENRRRVVNHDPFGSRAHAIFTFHVRSLDLITSNSKYRAFKIHFVDLAGVDYFGKVMNTGKDAADIGHANVTKTFLDQYIRHLNQPSLPPNDLVLRILGKSLSESSTLKFIGHVKMTKPDLSLTLSLLRFGARISGVRNDQKTRDPSLPPQPDAETVCRELGQTITAQLQVRAMLQEYTDHQGSTNLVSKERLSSLRSAVGEYLIRKSDDDELLQKIKSKHNQKTMIPIKKGNNYDLPIPTEFDFENDPKFNFLSTRPVDVALPSVSRKSQTESNPRNPTSRTNNLSHSKISSRSGIDSRTRIIPNLRTKASSEGQLKSQSLLQDLIILQTTKDVVEKLNQEMTPCHLEVIRLFENKLERERNTSEMLILPPSLSRSGKFSKKKVTKSQNKIRKSSSKKIAKSSGLRVGTEQAKVQVGRSGSLMHTQAPPEEPTLPAERELDTCGITIGIGQMYQYRGRLASITKRARASEVGRKRRKVHRSGRSKRGSIHHHHEKGDTNDKKDAIPIVPTSSLDSLHIEEGVMAIKRRQQDLDDAKEEVSRIQLSYLDVTRKLEWCRYQWFKANSDLQAMQENRVLNGGRLFGSQGSLGVATQERNLAEFINAKRIQFQEMLQDLLGHRERLKKGVRLVEEAQINLDAAIMDVEIHRPDGSDFNLDGAGENIPCFDDLCKDMAGK